MNMEEKRAVIKDFCAHGTGCSDCPLYDICAVNWNGAWKSDSDTVEKAFKLVQAAKGNADGERKENVTKEFKRRVFDAFCTAKQDCRTCKLEVLCKRGISEPESFLAQALDMILHTPEGYGALKSAQDAKAEPTPAPTQEAHPMCRCSMDAYADAQEAKHDAGKIRFTLNPPHIDYAIAQVREYGCKKYEVPDNWRKVDAQRYRDALMRHWMHYLCEPKAHDEESDLPHLWHVACNLAFLIALEYPNVTDFDMVLCNKPQTEGD